MCPPKQNSWIYPYTGTKQYGGGTRRLFYFAFCSSPEFDRRSKEHAAQCGETPDVWHDGGVAHQEDVVIVIDSDVGSDHHLLVVLLGI